ncbi:MAG: sugar phosphate isomerase/epimerase [Phycisphaeraceae bacterium]|nr:sugar phosphate isomerase/epimerase [Phycisphaeraceae bacterium]
MLLILSANSLRAKVKAKTGLALLDLPRYARTELDLHGVMMPTSFFAGADAKTIDRFRDEADKAECPCLVLVENDPQNIGGSEAAYEAALDRISRVLKAGQRLGCNAVGAPILAPSAESEFELIAARTRRLLDRADRMQINLLLVPCKGLTSTPEGMTGLIKKVGGFRIGSLPDFEQAAGQGPDVTETLRKIVPYASAVVASAGDLDEAGKHKPYDLSKCMDALIAVGYDALLAVEYRGKGDPAEGVRAIKNALEAAIEAAANK